MGSAKGQVRRSQEERSAASREKLVQAAFDLIRGEGFANFRVAAVAKAAGVSQGCQLHHFPNKDAIALAAVEYGTQLAQARTYSNLSAFSEGDDPIHAIAHDSKDYYFTSGFHVALDVTKSSSGNQGLLGAIRQMVRRYRDFAERSWTDRLISRGWDRDDAEDAVELTTALVRGLAIRRMLRSERGEDDRLIARWVDILHTTRQQP